MLRSLALLLPANAVDWGIAACPPLPKDISDMDSTLDLMSCIHGKQREASTHFYIRQWYRHIEELSMRAFRCKQDEQVQAALRTLELVDRALCLVKFKDCLDLEHRYDKAVENVCVQLEADAFLSCAALQDLRQLPVDVFDTLEKRLKKCNQVKDLFWEHLEQSPPGIVWTFGAHHAPKSCEPDGPDLASNLICNGWAGILVEGHPSRRAVLQNLFGHRHELVILSQLAMRDTVGSVLEDATWNNPQLRNQEVDLLQITFGANDCEIIRGILERGFRPRFVRAIFWHPVPPPLVYQPRVHRLLGDWYEDAFEATGEGCSLQAVADSLTDHYMFWDFDGRDCEKANFVRKDLMDLLPTDQIFNEAELDLQARWAARPARFHQFHQQLETTCVS